MLSPLQQAIQDHPARPAVLRHGRPISYMELGHRVQSLSKQLQAAGLRRGQLLACIDDNSLELVCLFWASVELGLVFFPLSPRFPPGQLDAIFDEHRVACFWQSAVRPALAGSRARQLLLDFELSHTAHTNHEFVEITTSQPCDLILTSGSTGRPKAALHTLANHIASAEGAATCIPLTPGDAWLLSLPLYHIGGLAILSRCALAGACVVLTDPGQTLAAQLGRDAVTHVSLVAAQLPGLLDDTQSRPTSLKTILLGGSAIGAQFLARLAKWQLPVFTSYGMTEMSSQITTGPVTGHSSGSLLPGRELKLVDGVIWVRGPCLFAGYLTQDGPQLPVDADGWFCSGDLGRWDETDKLQILGRVDNMFICGGENIQPEEIETALRQHPELVDAIVFGEPDARFGLLPSAIIRTAAGADAPTDIELTEFLGQQLARFKRPRRYYLWPENPWPEDQQASGLKVSRRQLIARVTQARESN